jgi:hypothetical protein
LERVQILIKGVHRINSPVNRLGADLRVDFVITCVENSSR